MIAGHCEEHLTATFRISYASSLSHILICAKIIHVQQRQETSKMLACTGEDATRPKFWNLQLVFAFKGLSKRFDAPSPNRRHAVADF